MTDSSQSSVTVKAVNSTISFCEGAVPGTQWKSFSVSAFFGLMAEIIKSLHNNVFQRTEAR